jgi:dTDP-4-amino-4,6-dideoxy-D-galactose acyltransferase
LTVKKLDWDSQFFKLNVGKVTDSEIALEETIDIHPFDLVYFFVDPLNANFNDSLVKANALLVDEKITYFKEVVHPKQVDKQIRSYKRQNNGLDSEVVRIGLQSGIYSRFNVDPAIPKKDFEGLYQIWMNRSIDREIADEVFVYSDEQEIYGIMTLRKINGRGDIGIIAVDEAARGKEIGKKMIAMAEAYCFDNNLKELQVVTQKANVSACRFYEKCGFTIDSITNIYHLWKLKN